MKIAELLDFLDAAAPFSSAADFDNCGLLVGDPAAETDRVLLALDVTADVLREAAAAGAGAVLSHHPLLFRPVKRFLAGDPAYLAARLGLAVVACHTNLDAAPGGVNDTLIAAIGLEKLGTVPETNGCCALCRCPDELSDPEALAVRVRDAVGLPCVKLAAGPRPVRTAAVCCGSGGSFFDAVLAAGADAFVTGDTKHSHAVDAVRAGLTLVDAGHYETERLILPVLRDRLAARFPDCRFAVADSCRPSWRYLTV